MARGLRIGYPPLNHFSLVAAQGSLALTGQGALFHRSAKMIAAQGSYALTGRAATLTTSAGGGVTTGTTFTWTAPTQNEDNSSLTDLSYYYIYRGADASVFGSATFIHQVGPETLSYDDESAPVAINWYWVVAVDSEGTPSDPVGPIKKDNT